MYKNGKKSFFMTSNANEGIHYKTIFFITDVDFFLNNFKYVTNEIDYNKLTREVGSETNCLENFFYQTLKNSDKYTLDFDWKEVYELIINPKVDKEAKIEFPKIDKQKIKEIMMKYEFSEERIENQLVKLDEINEKKKQRTLF